MVEYQPSALDLTYSALASDVRREILARLGAGEARVTDVAGPFDISLAAISKHIGVLERAGLVRRRIDGRTHWLSLSVEPLAGAEAWIEQTRTFWNGRLTDLEGMLRDERPMRGNKVP